MVKTPPFNGVGIGSNPVQSLFYFEGVFIMRDVYVEAGTRGGKGVNRETVTLYDSSHNPVTFTWDDVPNIPLYDEFGKQVLSIELKE